MQRRMIVLVCVLFGVVAAAAGYIVTGMSAQTGPVISAGIAAPTSLQATPTNPTAAPAAEATSAPTAEATAEATSAPEATAAPPAEATSAPEATAEPTAEATSAPEATAEATGGFAEYTVQRGDILQAIAKQYGVTVKDIIANNQIANPDSLRVGQVLRIPKK